MEVKGKVTNGNNYYLTEGKILARILRRDEKVAGRDWHPYVAEIEVPGKFPLLANESKEFSFAWDVPALAPSGEYQVDLFYLAGRRYVLSGLSYIVNVPGGTTGFTVRESGPPAGANFDRSSVRLAGKNLTLRSVPPTLPADKPISVSAKINTIGGNALPVVITKKLFNWSDTDKTQPLESVTETIIIDPKKPQEVSFNWQKPKAGVYELVLTALPINQDALPSILRVRFPVEGNTPRIIFGGITGQEDDNVKITACAVNGTFGEGKGTVNARIMTGDKILGSGESKLQNTAGVLTAKFVVPLEALKGKEFSVLTEAKNEQGEVIDSHAVKYANDVFGKVEEPIVQKTTERPPEKTNTIKSYILLTAFLVGVLIIAITAALLFWKRKKYY